MKILWGGRRGQDFRKTFVRITQEALEVLRLGDPSLRITQEAVEVLRYAYGDITINLELATLTLNLFPVIVSSMTPSDHITVFSEYDLGAIPGASPNDDWTERWHTTLAACTIESGGDHGGQFLRVDHSGENRYALSWDAVGDVADVDIIARIRWAEQLQGVARVYARGSGTTGETGYFVDVHSDTDEIELWRYNNGAATQIGSALSKAIVEDTWYWLRFRVVGTALKYKMWIDGVSEPVSWDKEETDATLATGWVGFGSYRGNFNDCDWFGVDEV